MSRIYSDEGYSVARELLGGISETGCAVLAPSLSPEMLSIIMSGAGLSKKQALTVYALIQRHGGLDLEGIECDPIAFRQMILLESSRVVPEFEAACGVHREARAASADAPKSDTTSMEALNRR